MQKNEWPPAQKFLLPPHKYSLSNTCPVTVGQSNTFFCNLLKAGMLATGGWRLKFATPVSALSAFCTQQREKENEHAMKNISS